MTAREEFCDAIINRNRIERESGCTEREANGACEACLQYTECQGRVEKAREAVRREYTMTEHPEPETIIQPSNHTLAEYTEIVLSEAEGRGVNVADLRAEYVQNVSVISRYNDEWIHEIADDVLYRLWDAGYANVEADDTLLIWPKGAEVPEEWRE